MDVPAASLDELVDLIQADKAKLNLYDRQYISAVTVMDTNVDDPELGRLRRALSHNPPIYLDHRRRADRRELQRLDEMGQMIVGLSTRDVVLDKVGLEASLV